MEKINVLVVEDELLIAQDLKARLNDHNFSVTATVDSGELALQEVKRKAPDLILMDIKLAGELDGISTAEKINESNNIPIIYLSDHVDSTTVNRAKGTHPANYLSKPFKISDLLRALEIAFYNAARSKGMKESNKLMDRVFLSKDHQTSTMVAYSDILYLEAGRSYCNVVTEERKYVLSSNMKKVFEQLDNPDFIRVHRSYVVNLKKICGIEGNRIKLGSGRTIRMSKEYRDAVFERLKIVK